MLHLVNLYVTYIPLNSQKGCKILPLTCCMQHLLHCLSAIERLKLVDVLKLTWGRRWFQTATDLILIYSV